MIDFPAIYGKALRPAQVAKIFGLDPRTVRKYARELGGIEVFPGTWRFFEKLVKERIDYAIFDNEARKAQVQSNSVGERHSRGQTVSGRFQGQLQGGYRVGKSQKKGAQGNEILVRHGIHFD